MPVFQIESGGGGLSFQQYFGDKVVYSINVLVCDKEVWHINGSVSRYDNNYHY